MVHMYETPTPASRIGFTSAALQLHHFIISRFLFESIVSFSPFRMATYLPSLTGDSKQISECWLCRDPRISRQARLHYFCEECKKEANGGQDSCPLCRTLSTIPADGCESIPTKYIKEKLIDLHQLYLEKKHKLTGEKIIGEP